MAVQHRETAGAARVRAHELAVSFSSYALLIALVELDVCAEIRCQRSTAFEGSLAWRRTCATSTDATRDDAIEATLRCSTSDIGLIDAVWKRSKRSRGNTEAQRRSVRIAVLSVAAAMPRRRGPSQSAWLPRNDGTKRITANTTAVTPM